jgi:hypothetical protein
MNLDQRIAGGSTAETARLPLSRRTWPCSMPGGIVTSSHSSGDRARRCLPPVAAVAKSIVSE